MFRIKNIDGLTFYNGAEKFAEKIKGRGSFALMMANTDTAAIPGITAAGASAELNVYTPPLDAEFVHTGRIMTLDEIPVIPPFIPTPGIITRAVVTLSDFRDFYVDAGIRVPPLIPHFRVGNGPGKDIRTGQGVPNVKEIIESGKKVGEAIAAESGVPCHRRDHSGWHDHRAGRTAGDGAADGRLYQQQHAEEPAPAEIVRRRGRAEERGHQGPG